MHKTISIVGRIPLIYIIKSNLTINLINILTILLMMFGSIIVFLGIWIINASYCFLTIEGLEVRNVISYGGRQMSQYPMGIYPKKVLMIFTAIIPFALVNYYPLLFLLGKSNNIGYMFLLLITIIYLIPCILIFNRGVKRYSSVGC